MITVLHRAAKALKDLIDGAYTLGAAVVALGYLLRSPSRGQRPALMMLLVVTGIGLLVAGLAGLRHVELPSEEPTPTPEPTPKPPEATS